MEGSLQTPKTPSGSAPEYVDPIKLRISLVEPVDKQNDDVEELLVILEVPEADLSSTSQ